MLKITIRSTYLLYSYFSSWMVKQMSKSLPSLTRTSKRSSHLLYLLTLNSYLLLSNSTDLGQPLTP